MHGNVMFKNHLAAAVIKASGQRQIQVSYESIPTLPGRKWRSRAELISSLCLSLGYSYCRQQKAQLAGEADALRNLLSNLTSRTVVGQVNDRKKWPMAAVSCIGQLSGRMLQKVREAGLCLYSSSSERSCDRAIA